MPQIVTGGLRHAKHVVYHRPVGDITNVTRSTRKGQARPFMHFLNLKPQCSSSLL